MRIFLHSQFPLLGCDMISFTKINGWQRLACALFVTWLIVGGAMYVYGLGYWEAGPSYAEQMPTILRLWAKLCGQLGIATFGTDWGWEGILRAKRFRNTFDLVGFFLFLLVPGALFAFAVLVIGWIFKGFGKTP